MLDTRLPDGLPVFISHKRVSAAQIEAIGVRQYIVGDDLEAREIHLAGGIKVNCPENMFARYVPIPGDYYVVYDDGYASFSPKKAFESGYSPAGEETEEGASRVHIDPRHHTRMAVAMYGQLLAIPLTDPWRLKHQALYAAVLGSIAHDVGMDAEHVQNFCERIRDHY